jgi:hypothetical protein
MVVIAKTRSLPPIVVCAVKSTSGPLTFAVPPAASTAATPTRTTPISMKTSLRYGAQRRATTGDVVVVTVNYRLGIFGFYGHDGLAGSGMFGLQDQQAALKWVRRNTAAFGGDPGNVTLAGESVGSMSTCAQLTSPSSAGLFAKAIMQSGSCAFDWPRDGQYPGQEVGSFWLPQDEVRKNGAEIAGELGCRVAPPHWTACVGCRRPKY